MAGTIKTFYIIFAGILLDSPSSMAAIWAQEA